MSIEPQNNTTISRPLNLEGKTSSREKTTSRRVPRGAHPSQLDLTESKPLRGRVRNRGSEAPLKTLPTVKGGSNGVHALLGRYDPKIGKVSYHNITKKRQDLGKYMQRMMDKKIVSPRIKTAMIEYISHPNSGPQSIKHLMERNADIQILLARVHSLEENEEERNKLYDEIIYHPEFQKAYTDHLKDEKSHLSLKELEFITIKTRLKVEFYTIENGSYILEANCTNNDDSIPIIRLVRDGNQYEQVEMLAKKVLPQTNFKTTSIQQNKRSKKIVILGEKTSSRDKTTSRRVIRGAHPPQLDLTESKPLRASESEAPLKTLPTVKGGSNGIHALLGRYDSKIGKVSYHDITKKRQDLGKYMQRMMDKKTIPPRIKTAMIEYISHPNSGPQSIKNVIKRNEDVQILLACINSLEENEEERNKLYDEIIYHPELQKAYTDHLKDEKSHLSLKELEFITIKTGLKAEFYAIENGSYILEANCTNNDDSIPIIRLVRDGNQYEQVEMLAKKVLPQTNVKTTSTQQNERSKKTVMSHEAVPSEWKSLPTIGDGSCGIHALLGSYDKEFNKIRLNNVVKKRKEIAEWIEQEFKQGVIPPLIRKAMIEDLSHLETASPYIQNLFSKNKEIQGLLSFCQGLEEDSDRETAYNQLIVNPEFQKAYLNHLKGTSYLKDVELGAIAVKEGKKVNIYVMYQGSLVLNSTYGSGNDVVDIRYIQDEVHYERMEISESKREAMFLLYRDFNPKF